MHAMTKPFSLPRSTPAVVVCLFVLTIVSLGFTILLNYESTPGQSSNSKSNWIPCRSMALASPLFTLVMVVHPQCPCTQASISELAIVMARCHNKVKAYVVLVRPGAFPPGWEQSDLWRRANEIPGVSTVVDERGSLSQRLKAATSGQCYLYNAQGDLLFSGGITGGRGHEGDNFGVDAVTATVFGSQAKHSTPVFGCPLFNAQTVTRSKE
jgi:hypothetical protein